MLAGRARRPGSWLGAGAVHAPACRGSTTAPCRRALQIPLWNCIVAFGASCTGTTTEDWSIPASRPDDGPGVPVVHHLGQHACYARIPALRRSTRDPPGLRVFGRTLKDGSDLRGPKGGNGCDRLGASYRPKDGRHRCNVRGVLRRFFLRSVGKTQRWEGGEPGRQDSGGGAELRRQDRNLLRQR